MMSGIFQWGSVGKMGGQTVKWECLKFIEDSREMSVPGKQFSTISNPYL